MEPFVAGMHYFHKAMNEVEWPTTKSEIIKKVGHKKIKTDWETEAFMEDLIKPIELENFSCAAEFYSAYFASM